MSETHKLNVPVYALAMRVLSVCILIVTLASVQVPERPENVQKLSR
jgi:hypothetical protein